MHDAEHGGSEKEKRDPQKWSFGGGQWEREGEGKDQRCKAH